MALSIPDRLLRHITHANRRRNTNSLFTQNIDQQRARNAVPRRLEHRLFLLVLLHAVEIGVEQVGRVHGAALGFRVELRGEDGAGFVDDSCGRGLLVTV
jgi:hypothetical protein